MALSPREIMGIVISLILIGIVYPMGLVYVGAIENAQYYVNGTLTTVVSVVDSSVLTLVTVIVPIASIISIVMAFLPRMNS